MSLEFSVFLVGLLLRLAKAEFRVELVQVLFRHGDRTPRANEMYPNDPYDVSTYEPWGLGQLTNKGKVREYILGKMLRERYDNFLGEICAPTDVYAVTTDSDRTKMSLELVLAGLFPPAPIQTWNEKLPWMPIPIHYTPDKINILMKGYMCPLYKKEINEVRNSEEILKRCSEYNDLFNYLTKKTGINMTQSSQVYEVFHLLSAQKSMNLSAPDWCTGDVFAQMQRVTLLEYEIRSYTPRLRRLHVGGLIKRFLENISANEKREDPRKIYLYSAHEVNVAAYAKAHNFTEPQVPAYGSAFILEKLRGETGERFVRILLWTGVTEELINLKLPGCEEICALEDYSNIVKDLMLTEEEENCLWDNITKDELKKLYNENIDLN